VAKPLARGPRWSAVTTSASCSSERRGRRPALPAPAKAARPPVLQSAYHFEALSRETPSACATSAWLLPRRNMSAARRRRCLSASKSRRGRAGLRSFFSWAATREPGTSPVSHIGVVTSMYFRKVFNPFSARLAEMDSVGSPNGDAVDRPGVPAPRRHCGILTTIGPRFRLSSLLGHASWCPGPGCTGDAPLSAEFHRYGEDFRQKIPTPSMSTISSLIPWARR